MDKQIVYITHNRLDARIMQAAQEQILMSGLPVVSVSLAPIDFGRNVVLDRKPSIMTMYIQIMVGLRASGAGFVFICEHDVLYHLTHFVLEPAERAYHYNTNVWRWRRGQDYLITYDHMVSLSGLCAPRDMLLNYYQTKMDRIREMGWEDGRNPFWARRMGHEPGKPASKGGLMDEPVVEWRSEHPNIDIRHGNNLTPEKMTLAGFRREPENWREASFASITGWDSKRILAI